MSEALKSLLALCESPPGAVAIEGVNDALDRLVRTCRHLVQEPTSGKQIVAQARGDDDVVAPRAILIDSRAKRFQSFLQRPKAMLQFCKDRFDCHALSPGQLEVEILGDRTGPGQLVVEGVA